MAFVLGRWKTLISKQSAS